MESDMARKIVNYLNNKDMLLEIHKSKTSFCEFDNFDTDSQFDIVIPSIDDITPSTLHEAKEAKAKRLTNKAHAEAIKQWEKDGHNGLKPKVAAYKRDPAEFDDTEVVFRVLTYEHIPEELDRKKTHKTVADRHVKMNFIPFKHYRISAENESVSNANYKLKEIGRSHYKDGQFSLTHGAMTDKLAKMFVMLVNKYGQRSNWRGYTYLDEMKGHALMQLSQMGLQFNEMKSDNPFSYFTASVANSFTRVLNLEKQHQSLRDDLLIDAGQNPSFTRQLQVEEEIRRMWESNND